MKFDPDMKTFMTELTAKIDKQITNNLVNFRTKAKGSMAVTSFFQGQADKSTSIANPDSVIYHISPQSHSLDIEPNPAMQGVTETFISNMENHGGEILFREQAAEWFAYHNIKIDHVSVRSPGQSSRFTERSALGSDDRQFFRNTFNALVNDSGNIIKQWKI